MVPMFRAQEIDATADPRASYARVVARGRYVLGPEVEAFETAWAAYCGATAAIGVGNGTDALELALRALGIGTGDTVACAANAGHYATTAILATGARPTYADIGPNTHTLDLDALQKVLTEESTVRAVIVTHLYGRMAPIDRIVEIAQRARVPVIEDCAQAHGAALAGRRSGSLGAIGCFSFYPTKNLGATGDGGAAVTSDPALAHRLRVLRQYGWEVKYHVDHAGGRNSRLDEVQAAVLIDRLPYLDRWNEERREVVRRYRAAMVGYRGVPPPEPDSSDVAHLAVIEVDDREAVRARLADHGVATDVHYPVPDHRQTGNRAWSGARPLPNTERASRRVLSLPCFPGIRDEEVATVVAALRAVLPATSAGD